LTGGELHLVLLSLDRGQGGDVGDHLVDENLGTLGKPNPNVIKLFDLVIYECT
jgi:hypothetical protein